jgi:hypothetical protein
VAAIKRAIETHQDFTGLANGGEAEVFAYARSLGMRRCGALVLQWQETYRRMQAQGAAAVISTAPLEKNLRRGDLDFWAEDDAEPDDDDLPEDERPLCGACGGKGRDAAGNRCVVCGGSGRAPKDDEDIDDDETEE